MRILNEFLISPRINILIHLLKLHIETLIYKLPFKKKKIINNIPFITSNYKLDIQAFSIYKNASSKRSSFATFIKLFNIIGLNIQKNEKLGTKQTNHIKQFYKTVAKLFLLNATITLSFPHHVL